MTRCVVIRLRLKEILQIKGMTQAELSRLTGINEDRICALVNNRMSQLKIEELGIILYVLDITPAQLFEAYRPSIFYGAKFSGLFQIDVVSRWARENEHSNPSDEGVKPLIYIGCDVRAANLVLDHALEMNVAAKLQLHDPGVSDPDAYQRLVREGTHVAVGSNLTSEISEYAIAHAYGVPAFDESCNEEFPFDFSWGEYCTVKSSFGFKGAKRGIEEGIYSMKERKLVARRTHTSAGNGEDCGLIVIVREELPAAGDPHGVRRERFIVVLAGHGRNGTLACATVLVDPRYQDLLYPREPNVPMAFVVATTYHRKLSHSIPHKNELSTLVKTEIVAQWPE